MTDLSEGHAVHVCHPHNLAGPESADDEPRFGIRVTLPPGDTFEGLLGADWESLHWYGSESERDLAYDNMAERHGYYRTTDSPTQILQKLDR